jgi:hypothetical protein
VGAITDTLSLTKEIVFPGGALTPPVEAKSYIPISMNRNPGEHPDGRVMVRLADIGCSGADIALDDLDAGLFPDILQHHTLKRHDLFLG